MSVYVSAGCMHFLVQLQLLQHVTLHKNDWNDKRNHWFLIYLQITFVEELAESGEEKLILQTQTCESIRVSGLCPALENVTAVVGRLIFPPLIEQGMQSPLISVFVPSYVKS